MYNPQTTYSQRIIYVRLWLLKIVLMYPLYHDIFCYVFLML